MIEELLYSDSLYEFLPKLGDDTWHFVPQGVQDAYIYEAEKYLNKPWELVTATEFMEYSRSGNRMKYEYKHFHQRSRLEFAVIAELLENKGRFIDDIINGVWIICNETWWGVPAHIKTNLPDINNINQIDLFAAETAQMLSWIYYLLKEKLDQYSPLLSERIEFEINKRILEPALNYDYWWKTRGNNWTTWIASNWLTSVLLVEKNANKKNQAIRQITEMLDKFYSSYHEDGGCDEGPSYWNRAAGSLLDCMELLKVCSNNKIDFSKDKKIINMGTYYWKTFIGDNYFVNFADARPKIIPNVSVVYRYGKYINDENLIRLASFVAKEQNYQNSILPNENFVRYNDQPFLYGFGRQLLMLIQLNDLFLYDSTPPLVEHVWLNNLQVFTARSKPNSVSGFYFAAKGGHNDESHNHNDIGSFMLYANGSPLLIDLGVEQYTGKTFSSDRYEIWTMQSAFHNLPTINGVMQKEGREYSASSVKRISEKKFSLDIAKAYPEEAQIKTWQRIVELEKNNKFSVTEFYDLYKNDNISITLMIYGNCTINKNKDLIITGYNGDQFQVLYDKKHLDIKLEFYPIEDEWLKENWTNGVTRVSMKVKNFKLKDKVKYSVIEL